MRTKILWLIIAGMAVFIASGVTAAPFGLTPVNLALQKLVVASSVEHSSLAADQVNDGDPNTRWSSQFDDNEWIYIDLGASYEVHQVVLNWEAAYGESYDIDVSFDGLNWETIFEERNGEGGIDVIAFENPVSARFVRMTGLVRGTAWGFSLWEFEIYGLDPAYRYVDGNGVDGSNDCLAAENPCATISHAIGQANHGNRIQIAAGAYTESFTIDKSLTLQGAGQSSTTIQAHAEPGIANQRVITIPGGLGVEIADVTIRHGKVTGSGAAGEGGGIFSSGSTLTLIDITLDANEARSGGGLYNKNNGFAILTGVTFSGNKATAVGGGMRNFSGSSSTLSGVTFINNEADRGGGMGNNTGAHEIANVTFTGNNRARIGGGLYNVNSSPGLNDVTFSENEASELGGGMYNSGSSPTLANVIFIENRAGNGGGIYNTNNSSPTLTNVEFIGNEAVGGGGLLNLGNSSPVLLNVTFSGNSATAVGGGILNLDNSALALTNVTINGNVATLGGGMFNSDSSLSTFTNTIIWGNTAEDDGDEIWNDFDSSIDLRYTLYKDDPGDIVEGENFIVDEHSLSEDPLFADAANGDLHLREGSPAINAADPDSDLSLFLTDSEGNPVDLDGNPRVQNARIDMGAYEFQIVSSLYQLYLPLVTK